MIMLDAWDLCRRGWTEHLIRYHAPPPDDWAETGDRRKPKRLWRIETIVHAEGTRAFRRASLERRSDRSCAALWPKPRLDARGTQELLDYLDRLRASRPEDPVMIMENHIIRADAELRLAAELHDDFEARFEHQRRRHDRIRRSSPDEPMTPLDEAEHQNGKRLPPDTIDEIIDRHPDWARRSKLGRKTE